MPSPTPLSIYVHWPYCQSRCHYCDFNAYAVGPGQAGLFERYFETLLEEFRGRLGRPFRRSVSHDSVVGTVFFGGGTPSLAPPEYIGQLLSLVKASLSVSHSVEITLEANPGTVSTSHLKALRNAGVNRLSLGVQSFRDPELRYLGRLHDAETAKKAVACVRDAGFENFSIDLIYGLPNQTLEAWEETLDEALEISPPHLSLYELTLEPGTPLASRLKFTLNDEQITDMHLSAKHRLESVGYEQYEISNYAIPGFRCRHNLVYWTGGDYLGLGAGAHSFLGGERTRNIRLPEEYRASVLSKGHAVEETERLPPDRAAGEAVMLGLRVKEGVDLLEVGERTGYAALEEFNGIVQELGDSGHVVQEGSLIRLTDAGWFLADAIAAKFIK